MRDLIQPYFSEYQKGNLTLTELANTLLEFDVEINSVGFNESGTRIAFEFADRASDATYTMEVL